MATTFGYLVIASFVSDIFFWGPVFLDGYRWIFNRTGIAARNTPPLNTFYFNIIFSPYRERLISVAIIFLYRLGTKLCVNRRKNLTDSDQIENNYSIIEFIRLEELLSLLEKKKEKKNLFNSLAIFVS